MSATTCSARPARPLRNACAAGCLPAAKRENFWLRPPSSILRAALLRAVQGSTHTAPHPRARVLQLRIQRDRRRPLLAGTGQRAPQCHHDGHSRPVEAHPRDNAPDRPAVVFGVPIRLSAESGSSGGAVFFAPPPRRLFNAVALSLLAPVAVLPHVRRPAQGKF